jgi:acyl-CoA reductase-like NAD-dependent aldehyde dehydrogenase
MFTGSAPPGAHFRRKFADDPHVILALELGGNNPLVVWDAATPRPSPASWSSPPSSPPASAAPAPGA